MRTTLQLAIRSMPSELGRIRPRVHAWLEAHRASSSLRYDVELVLEEIVANVIRHGGAPYQEIALAFGVEDGFVMLQIADHAHRFDPRTAARPHLPASLEDRQPSGLGLELVRSVAELLDYRREGDRNILSVRMREPLPSSSSSSSSSSGR